MSGEEGGLRRLELRMERLALGFRFTFAFHAREIRFEIDRGEGWQRVFPETFSFHSEQHDPAELYFQLDLDHIDSHRITRAPISAARISVEIM